ncbi:uncharacterized protein ACDP82_000925 [Pangshura tecta]
MRQFLGVLNPWNEGYKPITTLFEIAVFPLARSTNHCLKMTRCFYKELDTILCCDHTFTAKSPLDILVGLEPVESGLSPEDELIGEEVEADDVVQLTAGSLSGLSSQELFCTPEMTWQLQSGKQEAGEQIPDVALRGIPYTLVEHFCQIRKRSRPSKEDVFQEVMQCSDVENREHKH